MRTLITVVIAALSLNAFGQGIPQLPYNPDENGDGLIGVPDLQGLLSQYGLEFNSAVLSEDEESAIVYMGVMAHPVCSQACDNLPGFWHMSTLSDLGLVWDDLAEEFNYETWIKTPEYYTTSTANANGIYLTNLHYVRVDGSGNFSQLPMIGDMNDKNCYCAAHELPKVEYSMCYQTHGNSEPSLFLDCCSSKVQEGWYPLPSNPTNYGANAYVSSQAFWRWAE
jgi:hypothetical protein